MHVIGPNVVTYASLWADPLKRLLELDTFLTPPNSPLVRRHNFQCLELSESGRGAMQVPQRNSYRNSFVCSNASIRLNIVTLRVRLGLDKIKCS